MPPWLKLPQLFVRSEAKQGRPMHGALLMKEFQLHQSQLVIATHSPILLAYPNARIYQFSQDGIAEVKYTETEHYQVTKDFLNRHERMLEILLTAEEEDLKSKERR